MPSVFMTCWETSGSGVKAGLVHTVTMQRLTLWEGRPATSTPRVVVVTTATPYMNAPLGEIVTSRTIPPAASASGLPQSREKLPPPSITEKPRSIHEKRRLRQQAEVQCSSSPNDAIRKLTTKLSNFRLADNPIRT